MRVLVVANPRATATTARQRDVLTHALGAEADLEIAETANRGHAAALACRALRNGTDVVVALGGDGTINEVVNGLLTDGIHEAVPSLGIVPAGSTNVFSRALGIPNDPVDATAAMLEALRTGSRRQVSVGRLDDRWFVFGAGIGFDAAVVAAVEKRRHKGKKSTPALYARAGVREFLRADRRHPRLHVEMPDGTSYDDIHFAIVTNIDPWTYVFDRPLRPTPGTGFDANLGVYLRRRMGMPGMLFSMARLSGNHPRIGRRGAFVHSDVETLTVIADEPLPVQVDGDYLEFRSKVVFSSAQRAISVVA
jgi:diacylglycerol kinase family enzyme